jgi:hypothetical protein
MMSARTRFKAGLPPSMKELSLDQLAQLPGTTAAIPRKQNGRTVGLQIILPDIGRWTIFHGSSTYGA